VVGVLPLLKTKSFVQSPPHMERTYRIDHEIKLGNISSERHTSFESYVMTCNDKNHGFFCMHT